MLSLKTTKEIASGKKSLTKLSGLTLHFSRRPRVASDTAALSSGEVRTERETELEREGESTRTARQFVCALIQLQGKQKS